MKKLIIGFLLGLLFIPCLAQAQNGKHDIGISAGVLPSTDGRMFADILVAVITFGLVTPDDMTAYGSYAVDYSYNYSDKLAFGAFAGFSANKTITRETYHSSDYREENLRRYYYFVPTVKRIWSRSNSVNFYSYIGLGLCYRNERTKALDNNSVPTENDNTMQLAF
ncbi:MAG: hypothetical protein J6P44_08855 [Bacteroidales bacterium]|nr:hypothetical protein [Bacteroidales bacterium]